MNYGEELKNMPEQTSTLSFGDLPSNHWAYKFIAEMVQRKYLAGYPDGKFRPERAVTRAEFAKIMVATAGLTVNREAPQTFEDVKPSDWFFPFIATAQKYLTGYASSDGGYLYKPDQMAVREDVAVALVKLLGYDMKYADRSIPEAMFTDFDSVSEGAKDYVSIAVENKLISGFPDETFRAQDVLTRAQACALLWKATQMGVQNKVALGTTTTETSTPQITPSAIASLPTPIPASTATPQVTTMDPNAFIYEKLAGGNGIGNVDGPVSTALIGRVDSMVIDRQDNIYFIDGLKIRKLDTTAKSISTISLANKKNISFTNVSLKKLFYSPYSDSLYLVDNYVYPH